jgi:glycosyltransferase involved in cell wall biosynthesis
VHLVPNGVEISAPPSPADESAEPTVVFSGVMNYGPNFVAAEWFARAVWPRVRARVPGARYRIVGRRPVERIRRLAGEPGIEVAGPVPSMAEELRHAWVAIAPMRSGGGIKNKVLEAWAVGTPVVLTSVAANGLGLDDLASEFVADDPAALADRIVDLLESSTARARAGLAAWELARREHGWDGAARRLTRVLNEAVRTVTDASAAKPHLE